jgi:tRNA threonylcarbamoyladenosine biosynthesis protein TsaE
VKRWLTDEEATRALGQSCARALAPLTGAVVYLEGDLGAGKTTLARGLLRALGVVGPIRSPTYTLMEPYHAEGREILHLDLYRLRHPGELANLGLEDYPPEHCLWIVEWPKRGSGWLPPADLRVHLTRKGTGREADVAAAARVAWKDEQGVTNK